MESLPAEVIACALRQLSIRDIVRASGVCRRWRSLARESFVLRGAIDGAAFLFGTIATPQSSAWFLTRGVCPWAYRRACEERLSIARAELGFTLGSTSGNGNSVDADISTATDEYVVAEAVRLREWLCCPEDGDPATQPRVNMAAVNGDTAKVLTMLRCGADANCKNKSNGTSTLMCASANGQTETAVALLDIGLADANKSTADGVTALMYCAQNGHAETAKVLLEHGAKADAATSEGMTPLYFAAVDGQLDVLSLLVDSGGADVNARTTERSTALIAAATNGHIETVRFLLSRGADPSASDDDGWTPLLVGMRFPEIVAALLFEAGVDPNELPAQAEEKGVAGPLLLAAQGGLTESVRMLLEAGAQVDGARASDGSTPLMHAAEQGFEETVAALLQGGADPNHSVREGVTPLILAIEGSHTATVVALLKGGADPNKARVDGTTPLIYASTYGHREIASLLIEAGADVNMARADGITPLMYASERPDNDGLVEDLLNAGAYPNAVSKDGFTAFFPVAMSGNRETAALLRRWGADPDLSVINGGMPALAYAACRGNVAAVSLLLESGASVDRAYGPEAHTALIDAIDVLTSTAVIGELLHHGASPCLADSRGRTPLMYAARRATTGSTSACDAMKMLLKAGADPNAATASTRRTVLHVLLSSAPCAKKHTPKEAPTLPSSTTSSTKSTASVSLLGSCDRPFLLALRELLRAGADASLARKDGVTPLMLAARNGCASAVQMLLSPCADRRGAGHRRTMVQLTQEASNGWAALHFAASGCERDCVAALLSAGADPNHQTASQKTPLFMAIESCNRASDAQDGETKGTRQCQCYGTVKLLIERGASPNRTSTVGNTPLMTALRGKGDHGPTIDLLLDAGACIVHENSDGIGALATATSQGCPAALARLLSRLPYDALCSASPALSSWLSSFRGGWGTPGMPSMSEVNCAAAVLRGMASCHTRDCPQTALQPAEPVVPKCHLNTIPKPDRKPPQAPQAEAAPQSNASAAGAQGTKLPSIPLQKDRLANIARIYGVAMPGAGVSSTRKHQQESQGGTTRFPSV